MASYKGHLKGGIILGLIAFSLAWSRNLITLTLSDALTLSLCILFGSLLPDIDHPHSVLGRRVRFISVPIHKYFGHRSITHSIIFLVICTYLPIYLGYDAIGTGLGIGIISHILLDLLCPGSGVAFLYPLYPYRIQLLHKIRLPWKKKRRRKRKR